MMPPRNCAPQKADKETPTTNIAPQRADQNESTAQVTQTSTPPRNRTIKELDAHGESKPTSQRKNEEKHAATNIHKTARKYGKECTKHIRIFTSRC